MLLFTMVITFVLIFLAGAHFALWQENDEQQNLFYSLAMAAIGIVNLISVVGLVSKGY